MTIHISLFKRANDNRPVPREITWQQLCQDLGPHRTNLPDKKETPAFSPAHYVEGSTRAIKNVRSVGFGVLDIDKKAPDVIATLPSLLDGVAHILYTTWSHVSHAPRWCVRVVVPFSRPVLTMEWSRFWHAMNARFAGLNDPQCKDPSRLYFVPSCPAEDADKAIYHVGEGAPLDVDELLRTAPAGGTEVLPTVERTEAVDEADLRKFGQALRRKAAPYQQSLGRRVLQALDGLPFAEEGERDTAIFQVAGVLAEAYPRARAESIAALFGPALSLMGEGCPSVQDVADKITRHQDRLAAEVQAQQTEQLRDQQRRIRDAFGGNGRITPYTEAELDAAAAAQQTDREGLQQRWVIQAGSSYYFLLTGHYTYPVVSEAAANAALRDLAPAVSAQVECWRLTRDGVTTKSIAELVRDYGSVAQRVTVSLLEQHSRYDPVTRSLIEAPCPLRPLEPAYSPEVQEWLELLTGSAKEVLLDWLAVVTDLTEPCAAVYFDGAPGVGKTLLADGLARLWTTTARPTPLDNAMGPFNDALTSCPLVLADEQIPKDARGRTRTADLRQFIQARTRTLNRKFLPSATLEGAARLIITANNRELLLSQEHLTSNDIRAITNRLIYIQCDASSGEYLQSLGMDTVRTFVTEDKIARHALWLRDNRRVQRGKRFYVEGHDSDLHRSLTVGAGLRSAVCHWLVAYLLDPQKVDATGERLIRIEEGKLYATARGLSQRWDTYETHERTPSASRLSSALTGLRTGVRKQYIAGDGRGTKYWCIDTENLVAWAEHNGFATREVLEGILAERSAGAVRQAHAAEEPTGVQWHAATSEEGET